MFKRRLVTVVISLMLGSFVFSMVPLGTAAPAAKTKPAVTAAQAWLSLTDRGAYGRSWDEAASLFRTAVPRDQWVKQIRGVRKPLGKVEKRTLKRATPATSLPGAPDGQYVVIQFETSFANKASATETVTPMLDKDGRWRVSGYYIR